MTVSGVLDAWSRTIGAALNRAQVRGQLPPGLDTSALAEFMIVALEGVLAKASLTGELASLQLFIDTMFDSLLAPPAKAPSE